MTRHLGLTACVALVLGNPLVASADSGGSVQRSCAQKTNASYGFVCSGNANVGAGFEPVTFVGTVSGSESGVFEGTGVLNSGLGSIPVHAVGPAIFRDRTCFGHIQYQQNIVGGPSLPPLDIDFATVDGGFEILGATSALPGVSGNAVPRLTCRLVKVKTGD